MFRTRLHRRFTAWVALLALVPHLPRYHRSMTAYAREIADADT